ncbi:hypothetical protein METHB2_90090 [Candidatus Methylobacter favarea]|uniref:Uncharacterized protein n=1 Tax=Candidatus Methylobacter favarea TaxID=2707345 RepID=A0A8S0XJ89_9GAMM|nr:hypothetical protein METHB2_90090 [Candidatus Methylobacter favarea]
MSKKKPLAADSYRQLKQVFDYAGVATGYYHYFITAKHAELCGLLSDPYAGGPVAGHGQPHCLLFAAAYSLLRQR